MVRTISKINVVLPLLFIFSSSCFSQNTDEEKMLNTMNQVTYCINELDTACLYNYLVPDVSHSLSNIYYDARYAYYFMLKYYGNKIDSLRYTRDSVYDDLGRRKFTVHLFKGFDKLTGITRADLYIYLGPKPLFGLEKITGFELETDVDVNYRAELRRKNELLEIDELIEKVRNKG